MLSGNWGIFSLQFPYRNGISCYAYYLKLRTLKIKNSKENFKAFTLNLITEINKLFNEEYFDNLCNFFMNIQIGNKNNEFTN